ncbi:hypothetical protein [Oryzihumus leptocrescens]|uniref:hypothetical protein n=1 Tax=Oryzihumus leptocrescens TaxID=297536 RepID=UPI00114E441D|nr:hypothetical protein [Oryzihumus leptocrescens]
MAVDPRGRGRLGGPGARRAAHRRSWAEVVRRDRPVEVRLPAPPDWAPGPGAAACAAVLVAAVAAGVPRVRLGEELFEAGDRLDRALLAALARLAAPVAQARASTGTRRGGAAPASTARDVATRSAAAPRAPGSTSRHGQAQPSGQGAGGRRPRSAADTGNSGGGRGGDRVDPGRVGGGGSRGQRDGEAGRDEDPGPGGAGRVGRPRRGR